MKNFKIILFVIIGLLLGLIIHGVIEIPVIFLLIDGLRDLFFKISWGTWILVHYIFSIIIEILGVFLALWVYRKFEKD